MSKVGIIMGSKSDYPVMNEAAKVLEEFNIEYEINIVSAHRTPEKMMNYSKNAHLNDVSVIIAGAGGAAHLAGVTAALTPLPVLGVPMESASLKGMDSLLSTVQMPAGIPVGTLAIGKPGAINAALLAAAIIALENSCVAEALNNWRAKQTEKVPEVPVTTPS